MISRVKKYLFILSAFVLLGFFGVTLAASITGFAYSGDKIVGEVDGEKLTFIKFDRGIEGFTGYHADSSSYNTQTQIGDYFILDVYNDNLESARLHKLTADGTSSSYVWQNQSVTIANNSSSTFSFDTIFGGSCSTYECWFDKVWVWALAVAVPVSIIAIMIAGVIYSTSGGNPDRVSMAKKIIMGVLSGVGLLILSGVFKATILGV